MLLLAVAACGADSVPPVLEPDASPPPDAAPRDGGASLAFVDFAAAGCVGFDPALVVCSGQAPLELRFLAVAPAPLDAYLWSFGDGSPPETTPSPLHRYPLPGAYGVRLTVGGPGGTAQVAKDAYVIVLAAGVGERCELTEQCGAGLDCLCAGGVGCPAPLAGGLCSHTCAGTPCGAGQACVVLGDGPAAWQDSLCLRACAADGDCPGGRWSS